MNTATLHPTQTPELQNNQIERLPINDWREAELSLAQRAGTYAVNCANRALNSLFTRRTAIGASSLLLAGSGAALTIGAADALGQDGQQPIQRLYDPNDPNDINYEESKACLASALNRSKVESIKIKAPLIKRGFSTTKGTLVFTSKLTLHDECVAGTNSTGRLSTAGERTIAMAYRVIDTKGRRSEWIVKSPNVVGTATSDATSPKNPATHRVNFRSSADGNTSTGTIESSFKPLDKLRKGYKVQAGLYMVYGGLVKYVREDPRSPDSPNLMGVGNSMIFEGSTVPIKVARQHKKAH